MTKDAEYLLCVLYKEYTDRRNEGQSKDQSSEFGSSQDILDDFFGEWDIDDLDATLWELDQLKYAKCLPGDDSIYNVSLTTAGISYMESRFKNKVKDLVKFIADLKSALF